MSDRKLTILSFIFGFVASFFIPLRMFLVIIILIGIALLFLEIKNRKDE